MLLCKESYSIPGLILEVKHRVYPRKHSCRFCVTFAVRESPVRGREPRDNSGEAVQMSCISCPLLQHTADILLAQSRRCETWLVISLTPDRIAVSKSPFSWSYLRGFPDICNSPLRIYFPLPLQAVAEIVCQIGPRELPSTVFIINYFLSSKNSLCIF